MGRLLLVLPAYARIGSRWLPTTRILGCLHYHIRILDWYWSRGNIDFAVLFLFRSNGEPVYTVLGSDDHFRSYDCGSFPRDSRWACMGSILVFPIQTSVTLAKL